MADVWGYEAGERAYALVCQGNALLVVDVTDPASPVVASRVPSTGEDLKDAKTYGHYAYCVNQGGEMQVVDLADPYAATTVGDIGYFGGSHNCFIETARGLLFLCGHRSIEAFEVYDLNVDPVNPPRVAGYGHDYGHDVHVRGNLALVCAIADGYFELVDVTNLAATTRICTFTHPTPSPHSGWFTADLRYVLTGDEEPDGHLIVWDIQNPAAALPVQSYQSGTGTSIHNVHIQGNLAYLSYYGEGVRILDVGDPSSAHEVGFFNSPDFDENSCFPSPIYHGVWGVFPHTSSGNFYFGNMCGAGLYIARYTGPAGVAAGGAPAARRLALAPPAPNPAAGPVWIPFTLPAAGEAALRVHDAAGRVVATLAAGAFAGGAHRLRWDGRDARGQPVASGVYFIRLSRPGVEESRSLVRAR